MVCASACEGDCSGGIWRPRSLPISFSSQSAQRCFQERGKKPSRGERESWKISNKHSGCLRDLERPSTSAIPWECGGTFEGLVRKTCPAVSSTCSQLRYFATQQPASGRVDLLPDARFQHRAEGSAPKIQADPVRAARGTLTSSAGTEAADSSICSELLGWSGRRRPVIARKRLQGASHF